MISWSQTVRAGLGAATVTLLAGFALADDPAGVTMRLRLAPAANLSALPADMVAADGRTRWELQSFEGSGSLERTIRLEGADVIVDDRGTDGSLLTSARWTDPTGHDAAMLWVLPHHGQSLAMGARRAFSIDEQRGDSSRRHVITTEIVGIGWLHLPSGPREVVLQRAVDRIVGSRGGASAALVLHRWIDPLAGVVAETSGADSGDGRTNFTLDAASTVTEVITGAADMKIYIDQIDRPNFKDLLYGWDRGNGATVASLTPNAYTTIGQLVAASSWDFSVNTSGSEIGATFTPINSSETCNSARCGYGSLPATGFSGVLERRDRDFGTANLLKFSSSRQRENRVSDQVLWLRGAIQKEGVSGSFGSGETGVCYTTQGATTRTPVAEWDFTHSDAGGFYLQAGDHWESGPFNCEQILFNRVCNVSGFLTDLYAGHDASACSSHTGKQTGDVLKGGVVTLPSGHTVNALLTRTVADYCAYTGSSCSSFIKVDDVRTVVYLWSTPYMGTIARIQSVQNAPDLTSWTTVAETDFKFGLFPPRTISVTGSTATSVSLSWDPGLDTHRISGYKIYWDTDSGGATSYAFNSVTNAGQVSIVGTTATISGLTAGQTYYFTVVSRSNYTDPSTAVVTTYESLLYPSQVSGDPSFVYPIEVQATTNCIPVQAVTGLTVDKDPGGCKFCWQASLDPCAVGYQVLGSTSPNGSFTPVADVGLTTCWIGSPTQTFYKVIVKGTGGNGPQ